MIGIAGWKKKKTNWDARNEMRRHRNAPQCKQIKEIIKNIMNLKMSKYCKQRKEN